MKSDDRKFEIAAAAAAAAAAASDL